MQNIQVPNALVVLAKIFKDYGYDLYIVGGYIRNQLMGLATAAIDLTSPATPKQVAEILRSSKNTRVVQKNPGAGTVEIHIILDNKQIMVEHTSFRRDLYNFTGSKTPEQVQFTINPYEDANRRDFSVNCIYYDISNKTFFDPFNGMDDIKNRILKTTSANPQKIFENDAIRILRMVRFSCELGLSIDFATYGAAQTNVDKLNAVPKELIVEEFNKILLCDKRYPAALPNESPVVKGLIMLDLLKVWPVILPGFEYTSDMAKLCGLAEPDLPMRLAAILPNASQAKLVLGEEGLNYDAHTINTVVDIHQAKKYIDKSDQEIAYALAHISVDALIRAGKLWSVHLFEVASRLKAQNTLLSMDELAITGKDIMRLTPAKGKQIALVKNRLFQYAVMNPKMNTVEALSLKAKELYEDYMQTKQEND